MLNRSIKKIDKMLEEFKEQDNEFHGLPKFQEYSMYHTFQAKGDIVKIMAWYASMENQNEDDYHFYNSCMLLRLIIPAILTLAIQWYFSVLLQNYALDNLDPCEESCGIDEQAAICTSCRDHNEERGIFLARIVGFAIVSMVVSKDINESLNAFSIKKWYKSDEKYTQACCYYFKRLLIIHAAILCQLLQAAFLMGVCNSVLLS